MKLCILYFYFENRFENEIVILIQSCLYNNKKNNYNMKIHNYIYIFSNKKFLLLNIFCDKLIFVIIFLYVLGMKLFRLNKYLSTKKACHY